MSRFLAAAILLATAVFPAVGEEPAEPALAIPVPRGAAVVTEFNMDREQIIALASIFAMERNLAGKIDPTRLEQALGTLERLQFAEMKIGGSFVVRDMLDLFEYEVGGRRIVYDVGSRPGRGAILLVTPDGGYFGAVVETLVQKDGKPAGGRIRAGRTVGFPDVAKGIQLAAESDLLKVIAKNAR